jgi:hypothetical protein
MKVATAGPSAEPSLNDLRNKEGETQRGVKLPVVAHENGAVREQSAAGAIGQGVAVAAFEQRASSAQQGREVAILKCRR